MECAFDRAKLNWKDHVDVDARYFRPAEVDYLMADAAKASRKLGWRPKIDFRQLVEMMVDHDLELARGERMLTDAGHELVMRGRAHGY